MVVLVLNFIVNFLRTQTSFHLMILLGCVNSLNLNELVRVTSTSSTDMKRWANDGNCGFISVIYHFLFPILLVETNCVLHDWSESKVEQKKMIDNPFSIRTNHSLVSYNLIWIKLVKSIININVLFKKTYSSSNILRIFFIQ